MNNVNTNRTYRTYRTINRLPYKYILIMLLVTLSVNILSLALPLTMKQIYNRVIVYESMDTLIILLTGCIIALALEALLRNIKNSAGKWIAAKYEYFLSVFLAGKILNTARKEASGTTYSSNLEIFNSIPRVTSFFSANFYQIFVDLPFMFLFLALIYYLGGNLVIIPIILAALYVMVMLINSRIYFRNRNEQIDNQNKLMSRLTESLEKIHLIKAAGLEQFQIKKFKEDFDLTTTAAFKVNKNKMIPENVSSYFSQLVLFSVLCGGGYMLMRGDIYFGEVTACALLSGRAVGPVLSLMNSYLQSRDIKLMKNRLDDMAALEEQYTPDVPLFPEDLSGTVELIDVPFSNPENNMSDALTCRINAGSFVYIDPAEFLSYRNIFYQIAGIEKVEHGSILIDNLNISEWNMTNLKGKVEYFTDEVNIFKGSVTDNITYFNIAKNEDVHEAAALTGLDQIVNRLPEGFETRLDSHSANYLSASFMQKLNLTRALLYRPRILLLDRLDESMDYETLQLFIWLMQKLKGKVTIIIATGNYQLMALADKKLTAGGLEDA